MYDLLSNVNLCCHVNCQYHIGTTYMSYKLIYHDNIKWQCEDMTMSCHDMSYHNGDNRWSQQPRAPDEVTIPFLRLLEAKNTGSAKQVNHLKGDTPCVPAVQFPVKILPKM